MFIISPKQTALGRLSQSLGRYHFVDRKYSCILTSMSTIDFQTPIEELHVLIKNQNLLWPTRSGKDESADSECDFLTDI